MKVDVKAAEAKYDKELDLLFEKHGDASSVPPDEWRIVSERLRAVYCISANPDTPVHSVFKTYSIDSRVWPEFIDDLSVMAPERRVTRSEKINTLLKWASENVGEQVNLENLMEIGGIAYSMAKKIVEDRPDVFRKVKRGLFEIRDPEADRRADKSADETSPEEKSSDAEANDDADSASVEDDSSASEDEDEDEDEDEENEE